MKIGVKIQGDRLILDNLGEYARESLVHTLWMANYLGKNGISPYYYTGKVSAKTLAEIELDDLSGAEAAQKVIRVWKTHESLGKILSGDR